MGWIGYGPPSRFAGFCEVNLGSFAKGAAATSFDADNASRLKVH
jgi:hypothetical protein